MKSSLRIPITAILLCTTLLNCNRDGEEPVEEKPINTSEESFCNNDCIFAKDGACDDGGPDALYNYCNLGTDCEDCGERIIITIND